MGKRVLFLFLVGLVMVSISAKDIDLYEEIDLDGIDTILIKPQNVHGVIVGFNFFSLDTFVTSIKSDQMQVELKGGVFTTSSKNIPHIRFSQQRKKLIIYTDMKRKLSLLSCRMGSLNLNVRIPETFEGKVEIDSNVNDVEVFDFKGSELFINNSAGTTKVKNVDARKFTVDSKAGEVFLENMVSELANVNLSAGNVVCENIKFGISDIKNSTGNIKIEDFETANSHISNAGGNIKLYDIIGKLSLNCSMGSMRIQVRELIDDLTVTGSSGSVKVELPDDSGFDYCFESSLGSIRCDFPRIQHINGASEKRQIGKVYDGGPLVKVTTSCGSIKILQY